MKPVKFDENTQFISFWFSTYVAVKMLVRCLFHKISTSNCERCGVYNSKKIRIRFSSLEFNRKCRLCEKGPLKMSTQDIKRIKCYHRLLLTRHTSLSANKPYVTLYRIRIARHSPIISTGWSHVRLTALELIRVTERCCTGPGFTGKKGCESLTPAPQTRHYLSWYGPHQHNIRPGQPLRLIYTPTLHKNKSYQNNVFQLRS